MFFILLIFILDNSDRNFQLIIFFMPFMVKFKLLSRKKINKISTSPLLLAIDVLHLFPLQAVDSKENEGLDILKL